MAEKKRHVGEPILEQYTALSASDAVPTILKKYPNGTIHSVFNNSFNIIFQGNIIHVGANNNGLAPFGIGLNKLNATSLTKMMEVNLPVKWDEINEALVLPKGIILSLKEVMYKQPTISKHTIERPIMKRNIQSMVEELSKHKWELGLVESEQVKKDLLNHLLGKDDLLTNTEFEKQVLKLERFMKHAKSTEVASVFDFWIGRGPGLTPSGDDIITGICAGLILVHGRYHPFLMQLKSYLIEKGRERTTHIGHEYLIYATNAQFHTSIVDLCTSLLAQDEDQLQASLDSMRDIGHTSGADTLMGLLLAIKVFVLDEE